MKYFINIPDYYYKIEKNENFFRSYKNKKYNPEYNSPYLDLEVFREMSKGYLRSQYLDKLCYKKSYNSGKSSMIFFGSDEIKINYDNEKQRYIILTGKHVTEQHVLKFLEFLSKCYTKTFDFKIAYKQNNSKELINLIFLFNFFVFLFLFILNDLKKMLRLI